MMRNVLFGHLADVPKLEALHVLNRQCPQGAYIEDIRTMNKQSVNS